MADGEIWLSETVTDCTIPEPNTVFVFDEEVGASWWKWAPLAFTRMIQLDQTIDDGQLLAGTTNGTILRFEDPDAVSDLTVPITARYATRWRDQGAPDVVKIYRAIFVETDRLGAPLDVFWEVDDGKASSEFTARYRAQYIWGTATVSKYKWNNAGGTQAAGAFYSLAVQENLAYSLPQQAIGRRIKITIEESGQLTPFRILGLQLYYRVKQQRYIPEIK